MRWMLLAANGSFWVWKSEHQSGVGVYGMELQEMEDWSKAKHFAFGG